MIKADNLIQTSTMQQEQSDDDEVLQLAKKCRRNAALINMPVTHSSAASSGVSSQSAEHRIKEHNRRLGVARDALELTKAKPPVESLRLPRTAKGDKTTVVPDLTDVATFSRYLAEALLGSDDCKGAEKQLGVCH